MGQPALLALLTVPDGKGGSGLWSVDVIGPSYYGTANARWDGKTLVIDAQGFHDTTLLDASGLPHSDRLRLTERFQLSADGSNLDEVIHLDDPVVFSKAWDTTIRYRRIAATRMAEDVCIERTGITAY